MAKKNTEYKEIKFDDEYDLVSMAGYASNQVAITPKYRSSSSRSDNYGQKSKIDSDGIAGELENIKKGVSPFTNDSGVVSVADAIELCQKAYWNVAIFRSTIDIQTEFANSKIRFKSSNKTVERFFTAWYEKIGGWALADGAYREYFRSGNVFLYRFDGIINYSEYRKITRASVEKSKAATIDKKIPLKYLLLNPKDIRCMGASAFVDATYGKMFTDYELKRYKSANKTPEEQEFFDSLPDKTKQDIMKGTRPIMELESDRLTSIFCAKQDYEPLAVPTYYPTLCDINFKLEMRKADTVLARTIDYVVLLITCGDKDKDATYNGKLREAVTALFSSESVGRVLIADYSTSADFVIPDLNKVFGMAKYEAINADIEVGLGIFWGNEKFANSLLKVQVFLERLNQAREAFLNKFLKPQMKYISETLGFTDIPEVEFEEINLRDELEIKKLYVHMAEIGLLTAEELVQALKTGLLPNAEESIESQKSFKGLKDKDLYSPILNSKKEDGVGASGRPAGTKSKKRVNVGPIGKGSVEVDKHFSIAKIMENLKEFESLTLFVEGVYKDANKISRLSKKHKEICGLIADNIAATQPKDNWINSVPSYVSNPLSEGNQIYSDEVVSLADQHSVSTLLASILNNSKVTIDENQCNQE